MRNKQSLATPACRFVVGLLVAVIALAAEKTNRMLTVIAADTNELIENPCPSLFGRITISTFQNSNQLFSSSYTDFSAHRLPPDFGNNLMRQRLAFGNKNLASMRHQKDVCESYIKSLYYRMLFSELFLLFIRNRRFIRVRKATEFHAVRKNALIYTG